MQHKELLINLRDEVTDHLVNNLLPYWRATTDEKNGGFIGQITGENIPVETADKGIILNTRILWSFSASYRIIKDKNLLNYAQRAKEYLINYFWDKKNGGFYWTLDYKGNPIDTKKQIYAQGFGIYALSEYYKVTGDTEALTYACKLYSLIEEHSFDPLYNGYIEAFTKEWGEIEDMRLSDKDENEKKTMNTHLHLLESYTNLYKIWKDKGLLSKLKGLIELFLYTIIDTKTFHLGLFFDEQWNPSKKIFSFGHDIEASWLLYEAASATNDMLLLDKVSQSVPYIVSAAEEGLQNDGSLIYEYNVTNGLFDKERHWWVQAEMVIGYFNLYQYWHLSDALNKAISGWNYIKSHLIDPDQGEWFWSIKENGLPNRHDDKVGLWKCPYHNMRMCLELIERCRNI